MSTDKGGIKNGFSPIREEQSIVDNWFYDKAVDPTIGEENVLVYVCKALSGSVWLTPHWHYHFY